MDSGKKILALNIHPQPNGIPLFESDLDTPEKVLALFDACQILESLIYAEGWKFLIDKHGLASLYEIDKISGWFDTGDKTEWLTHILSQTLISGYNPQSGSIGDYDQDSDRFANSENEIEQIDWGMNALNSLFEESGD